MTSAQGNIPGLVKCRMVLYGFSMVLHGGNYEEVFVDVNQGWPIAVTAGIYQTKEDAQDKLSDQ